MSRSAKIKITVPHPLLEIAAHRRAQGHFGRVENRGQLMSAVFVELAFCPRPIHPAAIDVALMCEEEQNQVHDFGQRLHDAGILLESLVDAAALTGEAVLELAREWTEEKLAKRKA